MSEPERVKILGDYYSAIMDYQKECGYCQLLTQLLPQDPAPYINLGICRLNTFDYAAAIELTQKALQFVPQSRVRINLADQLFRKGDTAMALEKAQQFKSEYANDLFAQITLGRIYLGLGRFDEARQTFEHMVQVGGNSEVEGRLSLADLDLATGRYREAQQELQAGLLAAEKEHNAFFVQKARIMLALAPGFRRVVAGACRRGARRSEPSRNSAPVNFLLGRAYARSGQLQAAGTVSRALDALAAERDIPAVQALRYLLAAEIALAEHKPAEALAAAQKAVAYQNSSLAVETLARCYQSAGKDQEAAQQYEAVLARSNERIESFDAPAFHNVVEAEYRLAVLEQKLGRAESARTHLQQFLGYWSHADPDLHQYQDAQRLSARVADRHPRQPQDKGPFRGCRRCQGPSRSRCPSAPRCRTGQAQPGSHQAKRLAEVAGIEQHHAIRAGEAVLPHGARKNRGHQEDRGRVFQEVLAGGSRRQLSSRRHGTQESRR